MTNAISLHFITNLMFLHTYLTAIFLLLISRALSYNEKNCNFLSIHVGTNNMFHVCVTIDLLINFWKSCSTFNDF